MVYCDDLIIANRTEALIRKMFENQSTENVIDLNLRESNLEIFTKDDAKKINELFPKLIYLDISANNLKKLDDEIGILVDLELLFINDNQLNELPSGIKTLKIYQDL